MARYRVIRSMDGYMVEKRVYPFIPFLWWPIEWFFTLDRAEKTAKRLAQEDKQIKEFNVRYY